MNRRAEVPVSELRNRTLCTRREASRMSGLTVRVIDRLVKGGHVESVRIEGDNSDPKRARVMIGTASLLEWCQSALKQGTVSA
jgi:hypothetical protein